MQNYTDRNYHAAIYLRLSKEDGDFSSSEGKKESNSISNQRKLITDYIRHHPEITSYEEFCDDGFTGADFDRPDFQRMIEKTKSGEINCIIVKDLSRFGRDYIDSGKYIEKVFPSLGIRFIAINDNYDSAQKEQAGNEIILPFKNLINDSYSRDISIKVRSNLDIKRRNGEFVGTNFVYGYMRAPDNKNQLIIDKEAALVVESIFRMKIDGYSPNQIADRLNLEGIPSPLEYKKLHGSNFKCYFTKHSRTKWSPVAIYRILKNEMYTGTLVQGKSSTPNHKIKIRTIKDESEWIKVENAHEAIISPATFEMVQKLMKEDTRSPSGQQSVHIFSGKIYSAECGKPMFRKKNRPRVSDNKSYVYFVSPKQENCPGYSIREDVVYDTVLTVIQSQVALALDLEKALGEISGVSWEHRELEKIRKSILHQEEVIEYNKNMKVMIYDDFKNEIIDLEEYELLKSDCDRKITDANNTIAQLNSNTNKIKSGLTGQQNWLSQFRKYQNIQELNRRVIVYFIDRIEVTRDKQIHVTLNHADQFKAILEFLKDYRKDKE